MEEASSPAEQIEASSKASLPKDDWRREEDLAAIKREIRTAKYVYVYADFGGSIRVSRKEALNLLKQADRPLHANICTTNPSSVFIHADPERGR
ncbi:hypothetical protein ACE10Z_23420 [Bradyrhizobium sp. Pha-3]|uniref:hypothetical protein n=1 Tax=Bradyrhizobium sp. Pha-3 TaxID=208375 RepID=UPI0035D473AB